MYNNNFDDIKNLVEEMVDSFSKSFIELKNEWKMKNDDEKKEIVERIYQTKVDRRHAISFSVAEKAKIRHMLEDMNK